MEIICGSKKYEKIKLDRIVDSFDIIIRNNMNVSGNNYGKRKSNYQVLNVHLNQRFRKKDSLKIYYDFTEKNKIDNFYQEVNESNTKVLFFPENNTQVMKNFIKKNSLNFIINKQLRCGFGYMAHTLKSNNKPFLIGFSLSSDEFNSHQINNKLKKVNDNCHSRETEINLIKLLHKEKFIDATLCSILDREKLTLDCSKIEPTDRSINILLDIYEEIIIEDFSDELIVKLKEGFDLFENKIKRKL